MLSHKDSLNVSKRYNRGSYYIWACIFSCGVKHPMFFSCQSACAMYFIMWVHIFSCLTISCASVSLQIKCNFLVLFSNILVSISLAYLGSYFLSKELWLFSSFVSWHFFLKKKTLVAFCRRSPDCFSLGWPMRDDGEFFKSTFLAQVFSSLYEVT